MTRPLLFCILCCCQLPLHARTWTNTQQKSFTGDFIAKTDSAVTIKRQDGKSFTIPLSSLSEGDQRFLREQDTRTPASEPEPLPLSPMLAGYSAGQEYWNTPWPTTVKVEDKVAIVTCQEDAAAKSFVYESPHFHFETDAAMTPNLVGKIALLFESSYQWHNRVPLNNRRTRALNAGKLKVKLFETDEAYQKATPMKGSAGIYIGSTDTFMTSFSQAGAKKLGSRYTYDFDGDSQTLLHELTHQLWADLSESAIWFDEGFAEMMGCIPYRGGQFSYGNHRAAIREYALAYGSKGRGRALGEKVVMPHLEQFMAMSQAEFCSAESANKNYGFGLLLVTYFADMDGNKDGAILKQAIKAMQSGKSRDEIARIWLNGRSYEQLEKDFAKGWSGTCDIKFQ